MLPLEPCPQGHYWIFGYGSLLWSPGFAPEEARPAVVHGYHRRFCIYSIRYRGTAERPGLVLGLDRGGSCAGMILRMPFAGRERMLAALWEREMLTPVYHPRIVRARVAGGTVPALAFVVDRRHRQYTGRLDVAAAAAMIAAAQGDRGPCREYLERTVAELERLGLRDSSLFRLRDEVQALTRP